MSTPERVAELMRRAYVAGFKAAMGSSYEPPRDGNERAMLEAAMNRSLLAISVRVKP